MLLRQNESASTPREILLKKMPTILNFHIFKYQEIFGSIPPGRRNPSGYPHVQSAAGEKLNECGGVQLVPEAQKPADGTHIFRESLSLPTPASRGGINTPLSELSRATTYAPPQSSGAFSASSAKTHSSPSGPSWDEQHWPMNAAKVQTRQLETWSSGSEDTAGESGSRLTLFERRQRSGHTHIGIETSSSGADRVASKPKSSLQELLDYNKALNRSRQFEPQDKMPAPTLETPRRTIVSVMKSGLNDPNASPRKIFSWEKRLRTASDNLKQTLEDPAPHGVPHPVQKFLSPRANAAYVQQSPRLRTHFLGISPRPHDQNCKAKIDCWREPDRSRIEAGRPPYTSFAESLEQKYRRTLSQVDAYVHDFRTQSTKFPWKQAVATHFRADKCKLPNLDRSASMVKKPPIESAHLPHDAGLSLMPSRTRPRGKSRFENGPTIHAKKTKPATESAFLSKRSGSGGYEEFMKFLNNDVENFCSEIRDMCRSDYTAQQFVDAICNAQLNRRDDGEASDSASEYSADDPIGAVFHLHADVLQEICWSLANKLFLTDETHGVKLTPTQAMLITMRDFGIYPILLDTRQMFDIIMEAITGCVHGLPESETQRYQNILQAVILTAAVTVFRHDPLNLGVGHAIDADASESHLLHVMLIYMKLDERSRVDAFLAQFLTPQQAEDKLERLTAQKNLRNTIAQRFAGQSDPIMRTIRRWQRPLQDIFHFFSSHLKSASASDATAAAMSQRAIHESRNMPPTDTISKTNEEKLRRFNEKRLEVLRTLNISTSEDKKALPASPIDARRAALKRVSVLKAYGKIDAAEGAYLAECLAEPDELQLSATSTKVDLELSKKEQEHRKNKQRAYQYLISRTSDAKECLNSEDFIPLCNGDLATAEILFKCVKKKYADRVEEDEFVRSLWTDSLCETVLKTISEEEKSMMSPLQEVCGELPKAYRWAQEEYLKEDVADTARRFKTAYVEDIDHRIGRADTSKIAVWQAADDMLRELHAEVSEKIGAVRSRQTPKVEDDLDQLSSAFAQRMGYTDKDFIDVTDESYLSASQNYSVRRAVKTNQKAANEMMATAGAENLFGFKRTTSIQKSASVNDSEEISGHAAPGEISTFGALSFLVRMPTMKKRVMDKANAVTSWLDKDDDVPERCVSPNSVIDVGTMLKFAQVFGWIGSREQVEQGLALMDDLEFYEVCSRHSKMGCKFQLNWNSFLDMLIDVAVDFVKESHVHAHVHLDGTSSAYAEGLFMFMGLPTSTLSERDWLQKRMHEVLRFRLFDLVGLPAPKTLWLLPLANQPWRDGLHLLNDFRDVLISDMKGLLEGNVSKAACAEDWAQTVSGVGMTNTQYAGRVPSTGNVGHTPSRTGSAGFTAGRSPTRTLSTGSVFSTASNNPAHQQLSFFCIMICDSTTDAQFEKHCAIFQAVSWRHALRFFRMDTSNDEYKSGDFAEGLDWKKFPTMRLYCSNGLYREFEGCLDVSTIDHWFRSQGVHDAIRDEEHMDSSSKVSDALLQYLEVRDGVGEYLDAFLSLKQLTHNSGLRTVFPIKGFPSIFSVQVLELPNIDLSGSEVFPLAQCLKHNRKLIAINLENCRLQSDGLAAIFFALALNSKVKMLNLSSNAICVAVPSATPMGSSFTTLSTERVEEEDHKHLPVGKSVQALVDFVKCNTSLEKFELRSCGLNDVAIRAMSASLCVNLAMPLSVCDLSDNILGDDSVVALVINRTTDEYVNDIEFCVRLRASDTMPFTDNFWFCLIQPDECM